MTAQRVQQHHSPPAPSAEPGVEPELFGATPRRVVDSVYIRRWRSGAGNLVAGLLIAAYHFYREPGPYVRNDFTTFCAMSAMGVVAVWLVTEIRARRSRHFLRSGYAARATVEKYSPPLNEGEYYNIGYRYTHPDRHTVRENVRFTIREAKGVGEFSAGTTFTVLLDPREKYADPLPYFLVRGAEVPGASAVKSTPPPE